MLKDECNEIVKNDLLRFISNPEHKKLLDELERS